MGSHTDRQVCRHKHMSLPHHVENVEGLFFVREHAVQNTVLIAPALKVKVVYGVQLKIPEVGIYKRKQESKKVQKRFRPRKKEKKKTMTVKKVRKNTLSTKKVRFKKIRS